MPDEHNKLVAQTHEYGKHVRITRELLGLPPVDLVERIKKNAQTAADKTFRKSKWAKTHPCEAGRYRFIIR